MLCVCVCVRVCVRVCGRACIFCYLCSLVSKRLKLLFSSHHCLYGVCLYFVFFNLQLKEVDNQVLF